MEASLVCERSIEQPIQDIANRQFDGNGTILRVSAAQSREYFMVLVSIATELNQMFCIPGAIRLLVDNHGALSGCRCAYP